MVYATLKETILALQQAESALQSTVSDIHDRIKQGYVKEMMSNELTEVTSAFTAIERLLDQLNKTKSSFEEVRIDFIKHSK